MNTAAIIATLALVFAAAFASWGFARILTQQ
jgi:hypothetical protein